MAKRRRGKKRMRHNFYTMAAANPRRKRRSRRYSFHARRRSNPPNPRKRSRRYHYRRNPDILGFNLWDAGYAAAAVIVAPFIEKQVIGILPAQLSGTRTGRWVVKLSSAAIVGFAARQFLGQRAGNLAMIVLGGNLLADAVTEFAPQLTGLGYYPGLGEFPTAGQRSLPSPSGRLFGDLTMDTVDRLNPSYRF